MIAIALFAGLGFALAAGPANAQEPRGGDPSGLAVGPGLRVEISLEPAGRETRSLRSDDDLRLTIAYADAVTGRPAAGRTPRAWLRRSRADGGPSCTGAAWAVRATGAISPDDVALERSFVLSLGGATEDGPERLAVIDPAHRLKGANVVSVTPLGGRAGALLIPPGSASALMSRPEAGDVVSVRLPWGGATTWASGLDRPGALAALGQDILVVEAADPPRVVRLDATGARRAAHEVGPGPARLLPAGPKHAVVLAADGSALLLPAEGEARRLAGVSTQTGVSSAAVAAGSGVLIAAGSGREATVRWLDEPQTARSLALPFAPEGFFVRDDGRFGLAWSRTERVATVIDIARLRALAPLALDDEVEEVAAAGMALFLAHGAAPFVTVIDLTPVAGGRDPVGRRIRVPAGQGAAAPGERLIGRDGAAEALTVRSGSDVLLTLPAGGGLGDQPMSTLTIRGDRPRRIALFEQRIVEASPGRFTAPVRVPFGGVWEAVTTTGPGGTTACATFRIEGPAPADTAVSGLRFLGGEVRASEPITLAFVVENRPGWLAPGPVPILIQDMAYGSSRRLLATLSETSELRAQLTFRDPGQYAVSLEAGAGRVAPSVVVVQP